MEITLTSQKQELLDILAIQKENLSKTTLNDIAKNNGFVTVKHTYEVLEQMNAKAKQVIVKNNNQVVGYALVMLKEFKSIIPELIPMFETFEKISYNGKKLSALNYYVMGQICVQDDFKRQGIFKKLYQKHKKVYKHLYDYCITEVSSRNIPSMIAHKKVGFKTIHTFTDTTDEWNILLWDWS